MGTCHSGTGGGGKISNDASQTGITTNFRKTARMPIMRRNNETGTVSIIHENGYTASINGQEVFIQRVPGLGYTTNIYGMALGNYENTLAKAKESAKTRIEKLQRDKPANFESAKAVYKAVQQKGRITRDEYNQITKEAQEKVRKRKR